MPVDPSNPTHDEEFVAKLRDYQAALQSEFTVDSASSDDEIRTQAKALFLEMFPDVAITTRWLMRHASSDSVKLSAAKFAYEVITNKNGNPIKDPLEGLLKELQR